MDLILWRHADAEDGTPDLTRALTEKGLEQAARMAKWLHEHLPKHARVIASPATRAQQTARALAHEFETSRDIAPGASYAALLSTARWPEAKGAVVLVGHQPSLGETASMLLWGEPRDWSIKKGAIFWITNRARGEQAQVILRAALSPELV